MLKKGVGNFSSYHTPKYYLVRAIRICNGLLGNFIISISTIAEIKESTFNTRTYKAAARDGIMQIPSTSLELNPLAKKYTGTNK